jgi:hypothetical protein
MTNNRNKEARRTDKQTDRQIKQSIPITLRAPVMKSKDKGYLLFSKMMKSITYWLILYILCMLLKSFGI